MDRPWSALTLGWVAGVVVCAGVGIRWSRELSTTLADPVATTWISALGGAVIGGLISYFIARQASTETLKRDEDARTSVEHSSSLRAIVTVMQVTNRLYTLDKELEAAVTAAGDKDPWMFLLASAGPGSAAPTFQPGDFIPFIKAGHSDVVHRATLAGERLTSLEAAQKLYSSKRQAFQEFAAPYTTLGLDGKSSSAFTGNLAQIAEIKAFELNQLFKQMHGHSKQHLSEAQKLCADMNSAHQKYFGKNAGFRLAMDGEDASTSG